MSTAYHPQTDGATERSMQEIEAYLSIYCLSHPTDWSDALATLEFAYNSRPHAGKKHSSFELLMGYQPSGFPPSTSRLSNVPDVMERLRRLKEWRQDAMDAHQLAAERMRLRIDKPLPTFKLGDYVWYENNRLLLPYNKKIRPKRHGPFKITEVLGPVSYRIQFPKTWRHHDIIHSIFLSPSKETDPYGPALVPSPPEVIEGHEEYEVDHIVTHKRTNNGQLRFLIHWKGYGTEERSWEPASNLKNAEDMLKEYKKRRKLL